MTRKRPTILLISTPRQLRALRTPFRQELIQTLSLLGSASVKELAEATGRSPASLYYHMHDLERSGIIRKGAQRASGPRAEAVYEPAAGRIRIDRTIRSKAFTAALHDLHRATLNQAGREIAAALADADDAGDSVILVRLTARLSKRDADEARRKLSEVAAFMGERSRPEGGETLAFTAALARLP